ncbi:MAG: hypothetical protein ACP5QT_02135 [Brevinematia bacterium]
MDRTSEFFRGISSGVGKRGGSSADFLLFLLVVGAVVLVIWLINEYYRKNIKGKSIGLAKRIATVVPDIIRSASTLNAFQRKILNDMIADFKKRELVAEGVPNSIFEKFAEYLYYNVNKLKVSDREAREFVKINFPLLKGYNIEIDLQKEGVYNLISTKVIAINDRYIEVEYPAGLNIQLIKGMPLYINYNVGKHFLRGYSTIVNVKKDVSLVLKRPQNFTLSYERRYPRLNLQNATGTLYNPKISQPYDVEIADISFEGAKICTNHNLQKNVVYLLSFDYKIGDRDFSFSNLECSISKSFVTTKGRREYGLFFLYLNNQTRVKLSSMIKEIALQLQREKGSI